jgi:hypothetical protein
MRSSTLFSLLGLCLALSGCDSTSVPENDASTPAQDAGAMDVDASVSDDAGAMDVDAGAMDVDASMSDDAGPMMVDAGPMMVDAGPMMVDAGPMMVDAGSPRVDAGPMMVTWTQVHTELVRACSPCHSTGSSGGVRFAQSSLTAAYAESQRMSVACGASSTYGACAADRIRNGTMPTGGGIRPLDERARVQAIIDAWVAGGQVGP